MHPNPINSNIGIEYAMESGLIRMPLTGKFTNKNIISADKMNTNPAVKKMIARFRE
jgi:hypothetical protein